MAARPEAFEQHLVHTGQHYDGAMSQVFFDELEMAPPDENLEVGSGSHAAQTAQMMQRFEPVLQSFAPDWLLVVGGREVDDGLHLGRLTFPLVEAPIQGGCHRKVSY